MDVSPYGRGKNPAPQLRGSTRIRRRTRAGGTPRNEHSKIPGINPPHIPVKAGIDALPRERGDQPLRRADNTAHLALPPPTREPTDPRICIDRAQSAFPKTGNQPYRQRPSRRRGHHPHRVVNEQRRPAPPKRGSTTKNRNDSDTITHPPPSREL